MIDNENQFIAYNCLTCSKLLNCFYYNELSNVKPDVTLLTPIGIVKNELFDNYSLPTKCPLKITEDDSLPF